MVYLKASVSPGTSIFSAAEEAIRIANILGMAIEFDFNEEMCFARPGGDVDELVLCYGEACKRASEVYRSKKSRG